VALLHTLAYFRQNLACRPTHTCQGISFYDGHALAPWKIIYILLGGLAIVVGICVLIWLPDSPVRATQLTQEGSSYSR
jgi:hypothetical protein